MKTLRLILVLLLIVPTAQAQLSGGFELKTGYSAYAMSELGKTVSDYAQLTGYHLLKVTDNYPAYVTFGGAGFLGFQKWEWGIDYTYYTTAARAHYKDYSGEMGFDQVATAHNIGTFARYELMQHRRFQLKASLLLSHYFSTVTMNEYMREGSTNSENKLEVVSHSVAFTPMISPVFKLTKLIYSGARIGYCMDTAGGLHKKGDRNTKLIDDNNNQIDTEWSGFRSELFIAVKFPDNSQGR